MTISDVHIRAIAKEVIIRILHEGIVPSASDILRIIDLRTKDLDLALPEFSQAEPSVEYGEEASASKFNDLSMKMVGDLFVLYNSYLEAERGLGDSTERALFELDRLSRKTKSLVSRANRLLLTTEKTGGLLNIVSDNFEETTLIDMDRTTAFVDLDGHSVHSKYFRNDELEVVDALDFEDIDVGGITVTPLSPQTTAASATRDSRLVDMLTPSDRPWMYQLTSTVPGQVGIEVRIDFQSVIPPTREFLKTYKLILDPHITNNSLLVLIQSSKDGITWNDIPVADPTRRVNGPTIYMVEGLEFRFLRIILTRDTHINLDQEDNFIHQFGIKTLMIAEVGNVYLAESELVSEQHIVLKEDGTRKQFTKASLSIACEHREPDTDIEYFIAFLDNTLTEGDFQRIIPLSREENSGALIAEVDAVSRATTETLIDTTAPAFPGDDIAATYVLEDAVASDMVEVWRNVGKNNRYYSIRQADNTVVEDGWNFDGTHYNTYAYIDQVGGQEFDFGPRPIWVDGVRLTGRARLSEGIHYVKVLGENWHSLEGLMGVSTFDELTGQFGGTSTVYGTNGFTVALTGAPTVTAGYNVIDPLYPYNHKLLIEGLDYNTNFDQDVARQQYRGVARYAGQLVQRVGNTDLEAADSQDYLKFAIVRGDDGIGGVVNRVADKWAQLNAELPREQFELVSKTAAFAEGLVFKAIFRTTNPRRSASLDGYEIKIAE